MAEKSAVDSAPNPALYPSQRCSCPTTSWSIITSPQPYGTSLDSITRLWTIPRRTLWSSPHCTDRARVCYFDFTGGGSPKMYQIGNVYVITAIAIMGGGLFGFDISAMSAM